MRWIISTASRLMPVAFLVMAVVIVLQFWMQHGPGKSDFVGGIRDLNQFLVHHLWILVALSSLLWMLVFAGFFYERLRLTGGIDTRGGVLMDILDRLTNRKALEDQLAANLEPVVIDSAQLANALKSRVIGQDAVCDDIAAQIRRRLALKQRGKPVGVFMLAGPPGTGKTYLAKCLAKELGRKLLHVDMTQFSSGSHAATQLFGASRGYVGSDTYGKLTGGLRDTPDSVVLLDEIEKAHSEVQKTFLTAWNDGFLTEASDGRHVSTTDSIFVLTTNAATHVLQGLSNSCANNPDELRRQATQALREAGFAPEVLNRIDRIFVFKPLTGLDIARVTALEIEDMVRSYGLEISMQGIGPELIVSMMQRQGRLGPDASSRDVVRAVEESIADTLIEAKQKGFSSVSLKIIGAVVIARPQG